MGVLIQCQFGTMMMVGVVVGGVQVLASVCLLLFSFH